MNFKLSFFSIITILLTSCNNDKSKEAATTATPVNDTAKKEEVKVMIPKSACYIWVKGKDTIRLKTEVFPNVVTGNLSYKFSEKDASNGEIDGKLSGDTLLADYRFMSEGKQSVKQVAFLIKDSTATEGYGPMEEKEGKMVLKNISEVDFTKGTKLSKVTCPLQ